MDKIKPSSHKNYVPWFWRDWNLMIEEIIITNEPSIYELFKEKFHKDAEKDWKRWRIKLKTRWNTCAQYCDKLHKNLSIWKKITDWDIQDIVEKICNMDYESEKQFFEKLKNHYILKWDIQNSELIWWIIEHLDLMWNISKSHVILIEEK